MRTTCKVVVSTRKKRWENIRFLQRDLIFTGGQLCGNIVAWKEIFWIFNGWEQGLRIIATNSQMN